MHDPEAIDPNEPVVDEELAATEADLDAVESVLEAIDRDDLDQAEEIVTRLESGGTEPA